MRFRLAEDQRALRAGVRELLERRFDQRALRAAADAPGVLDRRLWRDLGAAGFFALRMPETEGGVGLGVPEAVLADEAVVRGARDCLQVHGGMGFTGEADVHLCLKRAWVRAESGGLITESEELLVGELLIEAAESR